MSQYEAWLKYKNTDKGKSTIKKYQQSDKFKDTQRKYQSSDRFKQRKKDHPEIYKYPLLTNTVSRILIDQEERIKRDPNSLTPEFISKISGICLYKKSEIEKL